MTVPKKGARLLRLHASDFDCHLHMICLHAFLSLVCSTTLVFVNADANIILCGRVIVYIPSSFDLMIFYVKQIKLIQISLSLSLSLSLSFSLFNCFLFILNLIIFL